EAGEGRTDEGCTEERDRQHGERVHRDDVGRGLVRRDVDSLRGDEGQVVESADAGSRRRNGESEIAHALEEKEAADAEVDVEGLADDVVHGDVGEPHARRGGEDEKDALAAAERPEALDEMSR